MTPPQVNPPEKSSGKDAVDKENKKGNKKDAKAADKLAKGKGIAKTPPGDASGTDRTSVSPSNQKTTKDVNHKADSNAEKGKKPQTDVPSSANTLAPSSGEGRIKTNDQTSLGNGKNSNMQNSVASNGVSNAASRSSKVAADSVDSLSKNNSAAEGFVGNSLTGTLADLKKQRAKRLQDALKENGKSDVSSEPSAANGDVSGNRVSGHTPQTAQTPLGNDRLQSRYDDSPVAATSNDDRGCCVIL